jgi:hypothetical protein
LDVNSSGNNRIIVDTPNINAHESAIKEKSSRLPMAYDEKKYSIIQAIIFGIVFLSNIFVVFLLCFAVCYYIWVKVTVPSLLRWTRTIHFSTPLLVKVVRGESLPSSRMGVVPAMKPSSPRPLALDEPLTYCLPK